MDLETTLEDGEIVDNGENSMGNYVVLERPPEYSSLAQPRLPSKMDDDESEYETSSASDSGSDSCLPSKPKLKRTKYKPKPKVSRATYSSQKKYDIWSTRIQEDVLLENLVNCDVSQVDRSRSVETYAVNSRLPLLNRNKKRSYEDTQKSDLRSTLTPSDDKSRIIFDLRVTVDDSEMDVASDIANKLYEPNEDLILNIVTILGKEKALTIFKKTKAIEENGGMLIANRSRRRTPGGIFLFLVKSDTSLTPKQHEDIFKESKLNYREQLKQKKREKLDKMKAEVAALKIKERNIPYLLSRADLCISLTSDSDRGRRKSEVGDVKNPPPSPVTDVHENSSDDTDTVKQEDREIMSSNDLQDSRQIVNYGDDFIDGDLDMEMF